MSAEVPPTFARHGDLVVPSARAQGPWGEAIGGRSLTGLVAWGAERDHGDAEYQPARLTVDMFRPVPLVPLRVVTEPVRQGRRIRVIDVSVRDEAGVELVRGTVVQLRRGDNPPGSVWSPPELAQRDPEALPVARPWTERGRAWELRRAGRVAWLRESHSFVGGDKVTPFLRAALAADATNASANESDRGLAYINADLTLYLSRLPRSEWIGLEAAGHGSDSGVAYGTTSVYDLDGRIGQVTMCALADLRLLNRRPLQPPAQSE